MYLSSMMIVSGDYVHAPRQSNITYIKTFIRSIYDTRRPEHPQFSNTPIKMMSPGTTFLDLLHGILTSYSLLYSMLHLCLCIRSSDATITASTKTLLQELIHCAVRYPTIALSLASVVPHCSTRLTWFDSLCLTWLNSRFSTGFDSVFIY